ncbi:hypothetical protein SBOR_6430 [Sclerotinia borealis F-4128]|uniref:Spherulin 4-like cell surface protein n=1 Tax=Sclerotinia borealis (strain F-4128) TaxID=1432307 RepID=W9CBK0_SCLBF|nr:hypothetical protein SBOR_6430 [Sclerotinia borealis F-4128]
MVLFTSILLPLYIYPAPGAWNWVTTAIKAYPSVNFNIIVNPNSGPGLANTFPDTNYIDAIASLDAFENTNLLGYVDTAYMHRTTQEVNTEVDSYNHWSTYTAKDIHVSGIFFNDCISNWNSTTSAWMSTIAAHTHTDGLSVMFNPGVIADPDFFNISDDILMVESTYTATRSLASVSTTSLVKAIVNAGIGSLYITTVEYHSESALWMPFVAALGAGTVAGSRRAV